MYAFMSAGTCEAIAWLLVYRKDAYQRLKRSVTVASTRLEKARDASEASGTKDKADGGKPGKDKKGGKDKRLVMLEREFETAKRDMMMLKVTAHSSPVAASP